MSRSLSDEFAQRIRRWGLSDNTIRGYVSDLKALEDWVPGPASLCAANFDAMTTDWLNAHRKTWAPKTTQRRMTSLRTFGTAMGWSAPALGQYRAPTPARPVPHPVSEGVEGVKKMLVHAASCRHRALIALCGLGGLRCNEARTLSPKDIDRQEMVITVMGKGSRVRRVPISDALWENIKDAWALAEVTDAPSLVGLSDRQARDVITRTAHRAGLKNRVSSHDLRATFATEVYGHTRDLRAVQELLGHASSKQTEVYTDVPMPTLRAAANIV